MLALRGKKVSIATALLALAAGCGSLDTPDKVHDLRILGMKAEPPDQVFAVPESFIAQFLDAGALQGNDGVQGFELTADAGSGVFMLPNIAPVTVTGLLADPVGAGRSVHWVMEVCPTQDVNTNQCVQTDPNTILLGQGDTPTENASAEVSVTFTPTIELLLQAFEDDPYHGFDFLPLYAQLTITAGTESATAFKRISFTAWYDPTVAIPAPDENPFIPTVTIGGQEWAESESVALDDGPFEVLPTLDPSWEVSYLVPTFQGTYLTFQEDWLYNYFATAGSFDFPSTGGEVEIIGSQLPIQSNWTGPGDGVPRTVTFWIVVLDGRGGENWIMRTAQYSIPDGGD